MKRAAFGILLAIVVLGAALAWGLWMRYGPPRVLAMQGLIGQDLQD